MKVDELVYLQPWVSLGMVHGFTKSHDSVNKRHGT